MLSRGSPVSVIGITSALSSFEVQMVGNSQTMTVGMRRGVARDWWRREILGEIADWIIGDWV